MMDLKKLKELAERATPGPWAHFVDEEDDQRICQDKDGKCVCCLALMGDRENDMWTKETVAQWRADAEYMAACSPKTVLGLIERIERIAGLEKCLETVRWYVAVGQGEGRSKAEALIRINGIAKEALDKARGPNAKPD